MLEKWNFRIDFIDIFLKFLAIVRSKICVSVVLEDITNQKLALYYGLSTCLWRCALWLNDTSIQQKVSAQERRKCL